MTSAVLCPLTSTLRQAPLVRITVEPSQLMVDKLFTVPSAAVVEVVGQLEPQVLVDLDLALLTWQRD
jgi:mRNA interferase MazF